MKFTTLLPLRFHDGQPVPEDPIARVIDGLVFQFGGCSDEGVTKGQWTPSCIETRADESPLCATTSSGTPNRQ
jgi:hypothetical protein